MKVFVVDPSLFTRTYDQGLARGLAGAGADVTLIGRPLRRAESLDTRGYRFLPMFYRLAETGEDELGRARLALKGAEHVLGLARLRALVARERPDIVHVQWLTLPFLDGRLWRSLARRMPVLHTAHNSVAFHNRPSSVLQLVGHGEALRGFTHYIAHTEPTAQHLVAAGIGRERITVLPRPASEFAAKAGPRPAALRDDAVRILLFGALKPYKGIDLLVEAGLALARRRRDFQIVVAGRPGFDLAPLQARVAAAGAGDCFVFDLRFLPDEAMAAHIDAADLVVFPYREFDTSAALTVAAKRGRAIVASAVGMFADPAIAASLRLIPPGDAAVLERTLEELVDDPAERARLAARAPQLEDALLAWPDFARANLEVYRRLLAAR